MAAAESARSAKRSPSWLWVPRESFRWMTGARSARSAGLLVGSTPSVVTKVQSAGQILSRLLANRRCQRVRLLLRLACSSSAVARFGSARSRPGGGRGRGARAGRRARRRTRGG